MNGFRRYIDTIKVPHVLFQLVVINALVAVSGFMKDVFIAAYVGTGPLADGFALAYFVIDTLAYVVVAGGIVTGSAVVFGRLASFEDATTYVRFIVRHVKIWVVAGAFLLVLMAVVGTPLFAASVHPLQTRWFGTEVYQVILPSIIFFPLYALLTSALQGVGRFLAGAVAPLAFNLLIFAVVAYLLFDAVTPASGVRRIAFAIDAGSICMVLIVMIALLSRIARKRLFKFQSRSQLAQAVIPVDIESAPSQSRDLWKLSTGFMLYLALAQCVGLVERAIALHMSVGSVAAFNYAYRLAQLPIWVIISAVGAIIVPNLAKANARDAADDIRRTISFSLRTTLLVSVPCTLILFELRIPIVEVLFQHGRFDAHSSQMTARFLSGYAIAVIGQAVSVTLLRISFALGRLRIPIMATFVGTVISVGFDIVFSRRIGPSALGIGQAIGCICSSVLIGLIIFPDSGWKQIKYRESRGLRRAINWFMRLSSVNILLLLLDIKIKRILRHIEIITHPWLKTEVLFVYLITIAFFYVFVALIWVNRSSFKTYNDGRVKG